MPSPYGLDILDNCEQCKDRDRYIFCGMSPADLQSLQPLMHSIAFREETTLFQEGQMPLGVFILCRGRVKLTLNSPSGATLIMRIVGPGELLGLSAAIRGCPYQVSAETLDPCLVNFVPRDEFLKFLKERTEICLRVARHLAEKYISTCRQMLLFTFSHCADQKVSALILDWVQKNLPHAVSQGSL